MSARGGHFDRAARECLSMQIRKIGGICAAAIAACGRDGATGRPQTRVGRPIGVRLIQPVDRLGLRFVRELSARTG